jgi:hypothetical protein
LLILFKISGWNGAQGFVKRHEWVGACNEAGAEVSQHNSGRKLSQVRRF